jgi:lipopolysaccharide transport system ATP-binding protein
MNKPSIQVQGLSKSYIISHELKPEYSTFKDSIVNTISSPFHQKTEEERETFWALKNINFEVPKGEVFGIVGKNGSGKSTLLKILSRTVSPTAGSIKMHGRVASLLEVGTGFHPELTGRENIFFNGSMLGMSKKEILKKFDEIVAFSEVEKFIDTPVKFYSSGMYVRLAFSVAAHLNPDVLILDEVLAVGDAAFQKKSLAKITETMEKGTTVLFVSHSMAAVQQLCSKGILLNQGEIEFIGDVDELADKYNNAMQSGVAEEVMSSVWKNETSLTSEYFMPKKIHLVDNDNNLIDGPSPNSIDKWVVIDGEVKEYSELLTLGVAVYTQHKTLAYLSFPSDGPKGSWKPLEPGNVTLRVKIPKHFLNAGLYKIALIGGIHNKFWIFEPGTRTPSIEMRIDGGLSTSQFWKNEREGLMAPIAEWEITQNGQ